MKFLLSKIKTSFCLLSGLLMGGAVSAQGTWNGTTTSDNVGIGVAANNLYKLNIKGITFIDGELRLKNKLLFETTGSTYGQIGFTTSNSGEGTTLVVEGNESISQDECGGDVFITGGLSGRTSSYSTGSGGSVTINGGNTVQNDSRYMGSVNVGTAGGNVSIGKNDYYSRIQIMGISTFLQNASFTSSVNVTGYLEVGGNLRVIGKIATTEVYVNPLSEFADYVFKKDYQLKSLDEVQKYTLQNSHLPGVISAPEIKKGGYSLTDMDRMTMEKVEELYLYIFELKKEIELLKAKK